MPISLVPMSTFEIPRANGSSCYCCCAVTAASDEMTETTRMRRWIHKQTRPDQIDPFKSSIQTEPAH